MYSDARRAHCICVLCLAIKLPAGYPAKPSSKLSHSLHMPSSLAVAHDHSPQALSRPARGAETNNVA